MEWIISANHNKSSAEYGYVDWREVVKYAIDVTVYVYNIGPSSRLGYVTIVENINLEFEQIRDDKTWSKSAPQGPVKIKRELSNYIKNRIK